MEIGIIGLEILFKIGRDVDYRWRIIENIYRTIEYIYRTIRTI